MTVEERRFLHSVNARLSVTTGRRDDGDELIFGIDRDELFG